MRIHSLTFRGVGPYRDEQTVDFDQLGESGLYLINGPTGAGKSTIIDCVTFALYGKLANAEADESRLRSDFCGPTDPTEVALEFETAAGRYRVIRRPAYQRAKARGSGTTTQSAECHLFRLDGPDQEAVAETKGAADRELQTIIGLTRDQFVQTVVLPQGQFATFLYSDTARREDVLKRIFDTRLFERVVDLLSADAASARQESAEATTAIQQRLGELVAVTGLDDDTRTTWDRYAADVLDDALSSSLDALLPDFVADRDRAGADAKNAEALLAEADDMRALAKAEADARAAADRARTVREQAAAAALVAREGLTPHEDLAADLAIALDDADDVAVWRARASEAMSAAGELRGLVSDEQTLEHWPARREEAVQQIEDLRQQQRDDEQRAAALPGLISEQEAVAEARPRLDEAEEVQARAAQVKEVEDQYRDLEAEADRRPALTAAVERAVLDAEQADASYVAASRAYREGIAAALAVQLSPGAPCPVCGATEHPAPAHTGEEQVDAETVESLRAVAATAQSAVETARTRLADSVRRVESITATIPVTREELAEQAAEVALDRQALADRSAAADRAAESASRLRGEAEQVSRRLAAAAADISGREASLSTTAEQMEVRADAVAKARGAFVSVSEHQAAAEKLGAALGALADRLSERSVAEAAEQSALEALAGFPDREGFADVAGSHARWESARDAHLEADSRARAAQQRLDHLQTGIADVRRLCAQRADRVEQDQDLLHLADLFSAGRGSDIGLHIYVLQSLFATVMDAANRRFESLLNGRYRLALDPGYGGDGRRLQGLGVRVEDRLTGVSRSAKTLSGGETFCASLALALGLSDVVRAMAGGVQIDSLFIDEGFGSLDNEQLDEVMEMLGHLSTGGRRVGLISHVDTMKATITEQIDITPATSGEPARLRVTWMDGQT